MAMRGKRGAVHGLELPAHIGNKIQRGEASPAKEQDLQLLRLFAHVQPSNMISWRVQSHVRGTAVIQHTHILYTMPHGMQCNISCHKANTC
jgi:hypothetical protein